MLRGSYPGTLVTLFGASKPSSLGFDAELEVDTDVVFTSAGDLVFQSGSLRIVDGVIETQNQVEGGIWKSTGVFLVAIMHTGMGTDVPGSAAPGTSGTFTGFPVFTTNGVGRVAFISQYEVGGAIQGRGLWAQDSGGELQLVALEGEPIMTRDGMKTVNGLTLFAGPSNVSGFSNSYNDRFEMAFTPIFDDFDVNNQSDIERGTKSCGNIHDKNPLSQGRILVVVNAGTQSCCYNVHNAGSARYDYGMDID